MSEHAIDTSLQRLIETENLSISDIDAMGIILHGGSVIDWKRLNFTTIDEVDRFLKLHGHDISDPFDRRRLLGLYLDAVEYLAENFDYKLPPELSAVDDVRTVFMNASGLDNDPKIRMLSCVVLKVMHIIHHMQARELLFLTPVSYKQIFAAVEVKVGHEVVSLQKAGSPIYHFAGTRKTVHNQVSRLIAAKEQIAARVYERASFQIVVEKREEILPLLMHLEKNVFPFNYVVPGTTSNHLIDLASAVESIPRFAQWREYLQFLNDKEAGGVESHPHRPRAIDFVVDMPLKLADLGVTASEETKERLGRIVFALVEFQLMDLATFKENENGETSISSQRKRLKQKAWERLTKGEPV